MLQANFTDTSVFTNTNIHSATYFSDTFCPIIVEIIVFREGTSVRSSRRSTVYTCDSTAAFTQLAAALPSVARAAATKRKIIWFVICRNASVPDLYSCINNLPTIWGFEGFRFVCFHFFVHFICVNSIFTFGFLFFVFLNDDFFHSSVVHNIVLN